MGRAWKEYHNKSKSGKLTYALEFKPKTYQIQNMTATYMIAAFKSIKESPLEQ